MIKIDSKEVLWNGVWKSQGLGSRFLVWKHEDVCTTLMSSLKDKVWKGLGHNEWWMDGWIVKLLRRFTSWNHMGDDSSVSFGIAMDNNKQTRKSTKADIGCQSLGLYQSPKIKLDIRCHSMVLH